MKVAFIIDQTHMHGGIERVLSVKANYLAAHKNFKVHIITTEQKAHKHCYDFNSSIEFHDLDINYIRNKSYFHPKNLIKLPRHILKLKKTLSKINPEVVVVCSHSTDTYFIPFINKSIPKVKEYHYSKFIEEYLRKNKKPLFKSLFLKFADYVETKYDKLVVLNQKEASFYKSNNIEIIPNPLTFYPDTVSNLNSNIVITAGRIAPVKGYDILIDIWELVHKENKSWQLHIYGSGEPLYMEKLQKQIDAKKLNESVFLKGATNQIQNKMLHSSLFVMTSHNECFPLVLLEAQACGLPVVSFDCPYGPRNIVIPKTGVIIKINDQKTFARTVLELMENTNARKELGKNARINADNYSIDKVMQKWHNMFDKLIKP